MLDRLLDEGAEISAGLLKVKGQVEFVLVTLRALLFTRRQRYLKDYFNLKTVSSVKFP